MSGADWVLWSLALALCLSACTVFLWLAVLEVRRGDALDASALEVEGAAL